MNARASTASHLLAAGLIACAAPSAVVEPPPAKPAAQRPPPDPDSVERAQLEAWLDQLRVAPTPIEGTSLKPRVAPIPRAKGDVQDVYKKVAPATVLIRSRTGYGTGVVIDAKGFVLTNHHVVASGETDDFRLKVWVEVGRIGSQGFMEKTGEAYDAYVHKSDPLIDLAVIKLVKPPPDLVPVRVARGDPAPGEAVSALGNGGIGLLWAIKDGEIASVGRLSSHLAQIAGAECQQTSDSPAGTQCQQSRQFLEAMKRSLESRVPGLVIQSSCPISPGDSGGPLVNRAGELVGVNAFLRSDRSAPVAANFHVHVAEVRKFLTEVPATPTRQLPDPWREAGGSTYLADTDVDGHPELLWGGNHGRSVMFVDLDQDSFAGALPPPANEVVARRGFEPELTILQTVDQVLVWYDADNDGRNERLLVSSPSGGGRATFAYVIDAQGELRGEAEGKGTALLDGSRFASPVFRQRLARVAEQSYPHWRAGDSPSEPTPPDPLWGGGRSAVALDTDRDGKVDSIWTRSVFSSGMVLDADESTLGQLRPHEVQKSFEARKVGADYAVVLQGQRLWSFVDLDQDESFDLLLQSSSFDGGAVTEAHRLENGRPGPRAPEYVGQKLIRPALLGPGAARLAAAARHGFPRHLVANDASALAAFPSPVLDVGADVGFEQVEAPGYGLAVVSVLGRGATSVLVDLDRDTFKAKGARSNDLLRLVTSGQFKAELAWMNRGGMEWAFYDTNRDGRFDVVLFTSRPSSGTAEQAFRIDASGELTVDPELAKGRMLRGKLFKRDLAKAFQMVVPALFQAHQVED